MRRLLIRPGAIGDLIDKLGLGHFASLLESRWERR